VLVRGTGARWHHAQVARAFSPVLQASRQPSEAVQPIDPLVIARPALAPEQDVETTRPTAHPGGSRIPQPPPERHLILRRTAVAVGRAMHRDDATRPPLTHVEAHPHNVHQLPALGWL
jgi:hypothetical protein